jgi:hypothetical protein
MHSCSFYEKRPASSLPAGYKSTQFGEVLTAKSAPDASADEKCKRVHGPPPGLELTKAQKSRRRKQLRAYYWGFGDCLSSQAYYPVHPEEHGGYLDVTTIATRSTLPAMNLLLLPDSCMDAVMAFLPRFSTEGMLRSHRCSQIGELCRYGRHLIKVLLKAKEEMIKTAATISIDNSALISRRHEWMPKKYKFRLPIYFEGQEEVARDITQAYGDPTLRLQFANLLKSLNEGTLADWFKAHDFHVCKPSLVGTQIMDFVSEALVAGEHDEVPWWRNFVIFWTKRIDNQAVWCHKVMEVLIAQANADHL